MLKVGVFAVFSLIILMIIPVYADVDYATIDKETFTIDDKFTISGTISDANRVMVAASMKGPTSEKLYRNTFSDEGTFSFIPIDTELLFKSIGTYTINIFTENQPSESGFIIKIEFDRSGATILPDYVLELKEIGNKSVDETKNLSFTTSVTDSSIEVLEYSLDNYPSGAEINKDTGKFSWTPTDVQSGGYIFDIVVKSGPLEDRKTITVTVNDNPEPEQTTPEQTTSEPEELKIPAPFVDESKDPQSYVDRYNSELRYKEWFDVTYPEYSSIYEAVGLEKILEILAPFVDESKDPQSYVDRYNSELRYKEWFDVTYPEYSSIYEAVGLEKILEIPAPFVDESKDPQSYVDRYNSEASYKKWFDDNYPEYSSIYEAVGLEVPKELASFVDPNLDPQYYIDRYNKEITYKKWFDKTYPEITIFEAVGLEEPVIKEPEFGECGEETKLIDGKCTIISTISEGEGYGIDVILKNIGIYSVAPVMLFFIIRKVRRARF